MSDILNMTTPERTRLDVMQRLKGHQLSQHEAAALLGLSVRQIKRLWRAYRLGGAAGLVSKKRGRASNHRLAADLQARAVELIRNRYADFGPTLAHEKLVEIHHLALSVESVRQLMIKHQLWRSRRIKRPVIHQLRERRACCGELVQIDGSPFDWFEGRAPKCSLLVFIDDATGRLLELFFAPQESFFAYGAAMSRYFGRYGKPVAFYSDKNSIFRVPAHEAVGGTGLTQLGRALQELGIQSICANTPQAKGRVERANETLQDRLVKELRLLGISSIDAANPYLPEFATHFNGLFAVAPRSPHDLHRPLQAAEDLDRIFSRQETRILSKNLTLQYNRVVYQVQTKRPSYALRNATVLVLEKPNGLITLEYQGRVLTHTVFDRQAHQAEIVSAKMLDAALKPPRQPYIPPPDHPWRRYGPETNSIARIPAVANT